MDNLNKTVSFVLGLVVVLVFLAIVTGRFNLKNKLPLFSGKTPLTPTTTTALTPKVTAIGTKTGQSNTYSEYKMKQTPTNIPATGSPTILLPLLFSGIGGGFFFKKIGKK